MIPQVDPKHLIEVDGYWTDDRADYVYAKHALLLAQLRKAKGFR